MNRSGGAFTARYLGESLAALVTDTTERLTHELMRDMAGTASRVLLDSAKVATPSRTAVVRNSWLSEGVTHEGNRYVARVRNDHWLAHLLSYGTSPHEIRPKTKRALSEVAGPRAGAHVRGITAHHMPEVAVDTAAATIEPLSYPARTRWSREVELEINLQKRRLKP
jgi:hypothetical protein